MKFNYETINKLNAHEIYKLVSFDIQDIYNSFQYVSLSEAEYHDLVINIINTSKKMYDGNTSYLDFLTKQIRIALSEKKLLSQ